MKKRQTLLFGGDFTLGKDPEKYMEGVNDLLAGADIRMFQLEEPFLDELVENAPPERSTKTLDAVLGKVDLVTVAGNHFYDYGEAGVRDTLAWAKRNGIACAGGGMNAAEAKKLFIHRSTLLYRLEKIRALLDSDLSDADELLYLSLSLRLLDD